MRVFVLATKTPPKSSSVGRSPGETVTPNRSRTALAYSSCEGGRPGVGPTTFGSVHASSTDTPTPSIGPVPPPLTPDPPPVALEPPPAPDPEPPPVPPVVAPPVPIIDAPPEPIMDAPPVAPAPPQIGRAH